MKTVLLQEQEKRFMQFGSPQKDNTLSDLKLNLKTIVAEKKLHTDVSQEGEVMMAKGRGCSPGSPLRMATEKNAKLQWTVDDGHNLRLVTFVRLFN